MAKYGVKCASIENPLAEAGEAERRPGRLSTELEMWKKNVR